MLQDAHIAASHRVVIDGFTGSDPKFRTRARLIMKIVEGAIEWAEHPDFGYDVAAVVPGVDDMPGRRYGRPARPGEHAAMAARLTQERKDFPGPDESLVKSLG